MDKHFLRLEAEKNASAFRSKNGFSGTEPIDLEKFVMKQNVITVYRSLSENLSGMAIKADGHCFVLINVTQSVGRQNFTLAHELYHLFIQDNFTARTCVTGSFFKQKELEEQQADLFAAALLLPKSGIIELIPDSELKSLSTETLFKIQHYFGVSMKCLIFRLVELNMLDKSYFDKMASPMKTAIRLGYPKDLYLPCNNERVIGGYAGLANELYSSDKISESFYLELLNAINLDPYAPVENEGM